MSRSESGIRHCNRDHPKDSDISGGVSDETEESVGMSLTGLLGHGQEPVPAGGTGINPCLPHSSRLCTEVSEERMAEVR